MTKLQRLKEELEKAGFYPEEFTLLHNSSEPDSAFQAIGVDTAYYGPYPTEETRRKIRRIEEIAKGFHCERRGYCSSVWIWEV